MKRLSLELLFVFYLFTFTVSLVYASEQDPFGEFLNGIYRHVNDIADKNPPGMEANEKIEYMDDVYQVQSWAWKLPGTSFILSAEEDSNLYLLYFRTTDKQLSFPGGIKVGASINSLEKFFGKQQKDTFNEDHYELMDSGTDLFIELDAKKQYIVAIQFSNEGMTSDKILKFIGLDTY